MSLRFHALGIPHTATNKWHGSCAYTQKVRRLCAMLKSLGHTVYHYGNERSEVDCTEHISVTTHDDLIKQYGDGPGRTREYVYTLDDAVHLKFYANCITEIGRRKDHGDFLLCFWGVGHKPIAEIHHSMIVVEPGIGYGGQFARWRVFESYAMLHAQMGVEAVNTAGKCDWYHVVIPNFFDPEDFTYRERKDNYLLFLGRIGEAKGLDVAAEVAKAAGYRLIVAGAGTADKIPAGVEFAGFADWEKRRELLANARALIAPSRFVEPFCGVLIEAAFSGTPVITVDWGAATEIVLHGRTGFRCRTFDHFVWAAKNIEQIRPRTCFDWAIGNFTTGRVRHMYAEYFQMLADIYGGKGWYEPRDDRSDLDWLRRAFPSESAHTWPVRSIKDDRTTMPFLRRDETPIERDVSFDQKKAGAST
jgi:glycosyltransferase involved in cell wall biosynthesis